MSATGEPVTRRKVFAGATALASTGAFLAACGASGGPQAGQAGVGEGALKSPVKVTLWDRTDTLYDAYIDRWVEEFNQKHEKVTIQYEPRPDKWGEKLTAAMVAGTSPDVIAVYCH